MTSSAPRASGRSDSMIIALSSALETTPVWLQGLGEPYTGPIGPNAGLERATEKLNSSVANVMVEFDVIPMQDHKLVEP
ncbi:quercetin 2,3-dioxygenase [Fusarium bulbicola]|nr:quercetin 2,3-dioxygenase [Fusarium bulbicola]